jgi:hypothetical protein
MIDLLNPLEVTPSPRRLRLQLIFGYESIQKIKGIGHTIDNVNDGTAFPENTDLFCQFTMLP